MFDYVVCLFDHLSELFVCLFGSEQRRHFQQVHPELSGQQLDVCMREAWQNMSGASKAPYITRALRAMQDRSKPTVPSDTVGECLWFNAPN